ncbi:adenosylcobinamide-GDP ribazoletransferase [Yoonia sp. SS1-5]|uniref:Adenosylcobinamide-GDP ribazoletransferase n=1 Tax=Yoonia rhodophyticola TaxID=3137370 RepID=A0AAN0MC24_9RHOB
MDKNTSELIHWQDVPAAFGLLTRLPIPVDEEGATARGARAAWAYPLVGIVVGVLQASAVALLTLAGLPIGVVAALILVIAVVATGAMHEDGLADSADGLWGGWDRDRRLEIMKDSHLGAYGAIALALSLLIRWLTLVAVIALEQYWGTLIIVGMLSRAAMVVSMRALPHARDSGLSRKVGRPSTATTAIAVGMAMMVAIGIGQGWLIVMAGLATFLCILIAQTKIGGQTGDTLGGTQQFCEIAMLLMLSTQIG